ncbi:MAG TPA: TadE/TadG family type IV pilus assembly protein [Sphingopyxis sp.]|nr:TadE/TadG family type IV pilus assembly protein [Sphingopyxis sp.]
MTKPFCLRRRARILSGRLARNVRGAVMIEMAFAIPFLALVGFGGLEIANLTLAHTRVSQLGLNTADNAARIAAGSNLTQPEVREVDINEVFAGAQRQAAGLNFENNGRIILSSLQRNDDGGQTIKWQRCFGNMEDVVSAYGVEGTGATGTDFPGMGPVGREVTASAGTAIMFVEVTYEYQPLLFGAWLGPQTIRSTAAYNIREARDLSGVKSPGDKADCD